MFYTHKELCTLEGVGSFTVMECLKHYLDCPTGYTELPAIMQLCWYKAEGGQAHDKVGLNMNLCTLLFKKLQNGWF